MAISAITHVSSSGEPCFRSEALERLGDPESRVKWVFLCGLNVSFDSESARSTRAELDRIGKQIGIEVLAIVPKHRSEGFDNKLHWPHNAQDDTLKTYTEIQEALGGEKIAGLIGFSNGGYFLHALAQLTPLNVPVVTIGCAGPWKNIEEGAPANSIYLMIGDADVHAPYAQSFAAQGAESALDVQLIPYQGGHRLPLDLLQERLASLSG